MFNRIQFFVLSMIVSLLIVGSFNATPTAGMVRATAVGLAALLNFGL